MHLGGVIQMESLNTQFKFNLTDQLPVIPVKYVAFAGYRGSRTKVSFDCVEIENVVDTTPTETLLPSTETSKTVTPDLTTFGINVDQLIGSIIDNELNEIIPKTTSEAPIELTTDVASSLL